MSIRLMSQIWDNEDPTLQGSRLVILLCLADCASDPSGVCWPSISLMAKRARIDRSNVMDHLAALEADGYITVQREPRKVNHYIVRSTPLVVPAPLPSAAGDASATSLVAPTPPEPSVNPHVNDVNRSISPIRIESADPNALEETVAKKKLTLGEQLALENQRADRAAQVYARTVQGKDAQRSGDTDSSVPRQPGDLEAWLAHLAAAKRLEPGQLARLDVKPKVVQRDEKTVTDGFSVREIWAHPVWRDQFQESLKAKVKVVKDTGARINRQTVVGMACNFRPEQKGLAPDGSILSTTPASSRPIETGKYTYISDPDEMLP